MNAQYRTWRLAYVFIVYAILSPSLKQFREIYNHILRSMDAQNRTIWSMSSDLVLSLRVSMELWRRNVERPLFFMSAHVPQLVDFYDAYCRIQWPIVWARLRALIRQVMTEQ